MILLAWLVAWDLAATLVVIPPAPGPALLGLLCLNLLAFLLARRRRHSPTATGDDQHRSDDDEAPPRPPAPPTTRRLRLPDHDRTGDDGAATAGHTHIYDN